MPRGKIVKLALRRCTRHAPQSSHVEDPIVLHCICKPRVPHVPASPLLFHLCGPSVDRYTLLLASMSTRLMLHEMHCTHRTPRHKSACAINCAALFCHSCGANMLTISNCRSGAVAVPTPNVGLAATWWPLQRVAGQAGATLLGSAASALPATLAFSPTISVM